jgi:hypothetical protein
LVKREQNRIKGIRRRDDFAWFSVRGMSSDGRRPRGPAGVQN